MKYKEITIFTSTEGAELISDIFWNYQSDGVAILDDNDVIQAMQDKKTYWDYVDDKVLERNPDVLVKGYVLAEDFADAYKNIIKDVENLKQNCNFNLGTLETLVRDIDGDEWRLTWKEHFKPIPIGKVVICPKWVDYEKKDGETLVLLESNMAFGTGEHETTSMCIELLQQYIKKGDTVLDIGCGSGILGITACKLGAGKVLMTDIDEQATKASMYNAKINDVVAEIRNENLLDNITAKGNIVLANIVADVLIGFSKNVGASIEKDGIMIISGIIKDRLDDVLNAYKSNGYEILKVLNKGEWYAASMQYKG